MTFDFMLNIEKRKTKKLCANFEKNLQPSSVMYILNTTKEYNFVEKESGASTSILFCKHRSMIKSFLKKFQSVFSQTKGQQNGRTNERTEHNKALPD